MSCCHLPEDLEVMPDTRLCYCTGGRKKLRDFICGKLDKTITVPLAPCGPGRLHGLLNRKNIPYKSPLGSPFCLSNYAFFLSIIAFLLIHLLAVM